MDLFTYFMYAAVTAIITLIVIIIALSVKAWFDQTVFTENFLLQREATRQDHERLMNSLRDPMGFDEHVASTPGMQNLN